MQYWYTNIDCESRLTKYILGDVMSQYIEVIRRPKTPLEKVISVFVNILCWIVVGVCAIVCMSTLNCRMQGVVTSIGGYSTVTIAPTGSMRKSGFEAWDIVLVKKVNPRALKGDQYDEDGKLLVRGDIIAYYKYFDSAKKCTNYDIYPASSALTESEDVSLSVGEFFGSQETTIRNAAKVGADMIFHHIKEVREDENGKLYFKTYGSSNAAEDAYWISEDVIIGKYYEGVSPIVLGVVKLFATQMGMVFLVAIPLMLVLCMVFLDILKSLALSGMEDRVLSGKLALDDPSCIANHIGIRMTKKNKYKVLAQLSPQERIEAVSYLWQSPKDIEYMKKYYIKQKLLLHYDEERAALKSEYAEKMQSGSKTKLAALDKEYKAKIRDIEKREEATIKKLKEISKKTHATGENPYSELDSKHALRNAKVKLKKGESLHIGPHKSSEARKIVERLEKIEKETVAGPMIEDNLANKSIEESVEAFKTAKAKKADKK